MYRGQHPRQYDRGHLVPSRTYSSSQERHDSTYTYTNAVPQEKSWNRGVWSKFESRIRRYAKEDMHSRAVPWRLISLNRHFLCQNWETQRQNKANLTLGSLQVFKRDSHSKLIMDRWMLCASERNFRELCSDGK